MCRGVYPPRSSLANAWGAEKEVPAPLPPREQPEVELTCLGPLGDRHPLHRVASSSPVLLSPVPLLSWGDGGYSLRDSLSPESPSQALLLGNST